MDSVKYCNVQLEVLHKFFAALQFITLKTKCICSLRKSVFIAKAACTMDKSRRRSVYRSYRGLHFHTECSFMCIVLLVPKASEASDGDVLFLQEF